MNAHTGNPMLISLELLVQDGLLEASDLPPVVPVGDCKFLEARARAQMSRVALSLPFVV